MDLDRAREFVREHHHAVMLTYRRDGAPQLSPVACGIDPEGRVVISTRETAMKAKNVARDPRVALCLLSDGFFGDWVQLDGTAEVLHLPDALEPLVEYYRSVSGEHPDWEEYRAAMVRDRRVLVRVEVQRAGPDQHG